MNEQAPKTVWYKVDARRWSLGLIWARSPSILGFLVGVILLKLFRRSPRAVVGVSLDGPHREVEWDRMPAAAQQALRTMIGECGKHSFQFAYCHTADFLGDAESYAANLLHADGRIRSIAIWTRVGRTIESGCAFASRLRSGIVYVTSNLRRSSDPPPGIHSASYPGASIDEIFSRHEKLARELGGEAAVLLTAEQLPHELSEVRRVSQAFSLARGALKPMTQAEVERLTLVKAELVLEPSDNPFQSPREDGPDLAPRTMTAWRSIRIGACLGFVLGALAGWLFRAEIDMPLNPNGWEELLITLNAFGWHLLPALIGAFLGWLAWRRAARTPFST